MKPVVVLVGQPNVGKSTLFNRLTGGRQALVADVPGLTRDRQYGAGIVGDRAYLVVDTGGLTGWSPAPMRSTLELLMQGQVQQALSEANATIFLTDGRVGPNAVDHDIAKALRRQHAPVWLAVNKTEGLDPQVAVTEFYDLGLGEPAAISARRGSGVDALMARVLAALPCVDVPVADSAMPLIAVAGRPNVGKSTLVNALLGEQRVLVSDTPGTTRDSIHVTLHRSGRRYGLIDTAGVRRRSRTVGVVEKYSVVKTLQAIEAANVVILVLDGVAGIVDQDAMLGGFVVEQGRALVVAVNKWDAVDEAQSRQVRRDLERRLRFLSFACSHFISAQGGTGIGGLFESVDRAFMSARRTLTTPKLNRILQRAVQASAPPRAKSGPIRLKYAHQGGKNPPLVVIHGTRVDSVPVSYRRYLSNALRAGFGLVGTPVRIELRVGDNPYDTGSKVGPTVGRRRRQSRRAAGKK
ncbi:MAG: ribosome biogenesis GTPase Der [Acidiferrobacterales bacterium]